MAYRVHVRPLKSQVYGSADTSHFIDEMTEV